MAAITTSWVEVCDLSLAVVPEYVGVILDNWNHWPRFLQLHSYTASGGLFLCDYSSESDDQRA